DEIVSPVLRQDLADPVRRDDDRYLGREHVEPLSPPAGDIRAEDLRVGELDLDLGGKPPASRPPATWTPIVRSHSANQPSLRAAVPSRRRLLLDQHAVDDLVPAMLLGDRQEVSDRRHALLRGCAHVSRISDSPPIRRWVLGATPSIAS